jgi:hypothetical protein
MMRDIRDKISAETQNMTFEELKAHIVQQLANNQTWKNVKSCPHNPVMDQKPQSPKG